MVSISTTTRSAAHGTGAALDCRRRITRAASIFSGTAMTLEPKLSMSGTAPPARSRTTERGRPRRPPGAPAQSRRSASRGPFRGEPSQSVPDGDRGHASEIPCIVRLMAPSQKELDVPRQRLVLVDGGGERRADDRAGVAVAQVRAPASALRRPRRWALSRPSPTREPHALTLRRPIPLRPAACPSPWRPVRHAPRGS